MVKKFEAVNEVLKFDNVTLNPITFHAFEHQSELFDIIIIYNAINHLDEIAYINLLDGLNSMSAYQIFSQK